MVHESACASASSTLSTTKSCTLILGCSVSTVISAMGSPGSSDSLLTTHTTVHWISFGAVRVPSRARHFVCADHLCERTEYCQEMSAVCLGPAAQPTRAAHIAEAANLLV
jgi:hypothetical protein